MSFGSAPWQTLNEIHQVAGNFKLVLNRNQSNAVEIGLFAVHYVVAPFDDFSDFLLSLVFIRSFFIAFGPFFIQTI